MRKITIFAMICSLALLISCSKGDTGAPGATGPTGAPGNANVTTDIYSVANTQWNTSVPGETYTVILSDPNISNYAADNVSVSEQPSGNTSFVELPANSVITGGDEMGVIVSNSQVEIYYFATSAPAINLNFKVTVIPPAP